MTYPPNLVVPDGPFYGCHRDECNEDNCFEAEELKWSNIDGGSFHCADCMMDIESDGGLYDEGPSLEVGATLDVYQSEGNDKANHATRPRYQCGGDETRVYPPEELHYHPGTAKGIKPGFYNEFYLDDNLLDPSGTTFADWLKQQGRER